MKYLYKPFPYDEFVNDKNMIDHLLDNFHCHKSKQMLDFLLLNYTFKKTTADVPTRQNIT